MAMNLLKEMQAHELVQSARGQKVDLLGLRVLTQPFGEWPGVRASGKLPALAGHHW